ncbi:MAG: exodeoxyribonuclease VII small subunit [Candidatus Hydrogenedentota bacterium]|nr:MAG: exodeoxyribonuclease VII small subunit [Candidatus Hydrogenedentota bacterium]
MAEPKFEKDLEKLEKLVDELEEGGLALDVSLKKFEDGVKLAQRCEQALGSAEKKIEKLTKSASGALKAVPLNDEEEDEEDDAEVDEDGELLF